MTDSPRSNNRNGRPAFDISGAFMHKQESLEAAFYAIRNVTSHPGTKGDKLEADWVGMIRDFLPTRYEVGPVFAVDHTGAMSEQIDVAVYDQHYSPQWFGGANGLRFVPVESVYAAFEVKPELNRRNLEYAGKKVASVRRLSRTSAPVVHKGGRFEASQIDVRPILGGILTNRTKWSETATLKKLAACQVGDENAPEFLDIGIALDTICFDYTPVRNGEMVSIECSTSQPGHQLIHFAIRLFRQLQAIGTVPAVDMEKYEEALYGGLESATDHDD